MRPKTILLMAVSAAALSLPLVALAQGYYGQPGGDPTYQPRGDQSYYYQPDRDQSYQAREDQPYYQHPRGDWYGRDRMIFQGYPEFRRVEAHIQAEINDGVREDWLAPEDAADFKRQLRTIQARELKEYREHGWNLPEYDRRAIRFRLGALDSLVDQTRGEP